MAKLIFTPIENSSQLSGQHYDEVTQTLTLQFKNGKYYEYFKVTQHTVDEFNAAESQGKYFHAYINGNHEFKKLTYEP